MSEQRPTTSEPITSATADGGAKLRLSKSFIVVSLAVLLLTGFGAMVVVFNSPYLDVQQIEVEGADAVKSVALAQLTGLKGQHMLLADVDAAERRIAALTMVKSATVSKDWPNTIRVVIIEREPWGRWRANGAVWSIDAEGVVLEGAALPDEGPLVTQTSALPAIRAGERVDTTAVELVAALHERGAPLSLPSVVAYEWTLSEGLAVVTDHGRVVFGDGEGLEFKYAVWDQLEREAQARGEPLLFADLRFGLRPRVEIGLGVGRAIRGQPGASAALE